MIYDSPSKVPYEPTVIEERSIVPHQTRKDSPFIPLADPHLPDPGGYLVITTVSGGTAASGASLYYAPQYHYFRLIPPFVDKAQYEMGLQQFAKNSEQVTYPKELKEDSTT